MLRIRLTRIGNRKNLPKFRIVVADKSASIKGKFLEIVGNYCPIVNPKTFHAEKDRILYWISKGAKPTHSVASLLKKHLNMENMDRFMEIRNKKRSKKKDSKKTQSAQPVAA